MYIILSLFDYFTLLVYTSDLHRRRSLPSLKGSNCMNKLYEKVIGRVSEIRKTRLTLLRYISFLLLQLPNLLLRSLL